MLNYSSTIFLGVNVSRVLREGHLGNECLGDIECCNDAKVSLFVVFLVCIYPHLE